MGYRWGRAAGAGLMIAAAGWAAPAQADPIDTSFLSELGGAGLPVGNPAATSALGQSVCPMLAEPAGAAASVAAPVSGLGGGPAMPPEMAKLFTEIAVQMYCPQMLSRLASGQIPELPQIPGMPGFGGGVPAGSVFDGIPAIPVLGDLPPIPALPALPVGR